MKFCKMQGGLHLEMRDGQDYDQENDREDNREVDGAGSRHRRAAPSVACPISFNDSCAML
jgi:hypothetical protein